jgi:hypothetical protein
VLLVQQPSHRGNDEGQKQQKHAARMRIRAPENCMKKLRG